MRYTLTHTGHGFQFHSFFRRIEKRKKTNQQRQRPNEKMTAVVEFYEFGEQ